MGALIFRHTQIDGNNDFSLCNLNHLIQNDSHELNDAQMADGPNRMRTNCIMLSMDRVGVCAVGKGGI